MSPINRWAAPAALTAGVVLVLVAGVLAGLVTANPPGLSAKRFAATVERCRLFPWYANSRL